MSYLAGPSPVTHLLSKLFWAGFYRSFGFWLISSLVPGRVAIETTLAFGKRPPQMYLRKSLITDGVPDSNFKMTWNLSALLLRIENS
jgi:hypothetical protein